ncbi:5-methylcytosine-specific restriction endonuclease McrBC GTP-binding regulatory subunit McrB [Epilithonimonas arachidiradicis]|uniref:5-methylcytosine-specific restriction endonuclease McrBC GTP-binding regulatory subunit McrB n=1 Tax=Epilithonimonas arachidiradicis TaxID=1617282 RepID=A0A420CM33_9FLAO|nr:5-methylcytosine-specific restriction endonuclease McrBC GTP-binding regulatory subunit McrB [Epilithonimonas arachidiradicis]
MLTDQLPEGFFWNSDHGGTENSIAFENNIDFQDQDIFSKLEKALFQFEETLGEKVRNLVFRDVKKEFINWFVSREEKELKTYFSKQFNGNMERFESEIDSYEKWYKTDFETDLFLIDVTDAQNKYNEISKNVYSNSPSFSKNGREKGNYRPTAILGKNNYLTFLKEYFKLNSDTLYTNKNTPIHMPLNQILYGPPGTGKTYNTINKAISILENKYEIELKDENRNDLKQRFESYIESGQVVFTTFHQSMSYEDFVEGIKPQTKNEQVTYSVEDGLFKSFVKKALIEYLDKDDEVSESDDFDSIYNSYINSIKDFENKREGIFTTKTGVEIMLIDANENSILVKYLWSNKNKTEEGQHTFSVTKEKLKKVLLEGIEPDKVKSLKAELHPIVGHIHCELFAVYKSFYEFVIANKGEIETIYFNYEDQSYEEIKDQFDALDKQSLQNKNVKKYVLIIDEINRGNVSQIFGELITLIEESKRLDADESLEVKLPYSKKEFGVPSNFYIIGTMNTADRSVEALDTALRRRFTFEEMLPKPFLLKDKNIGTVNLEEVLTIINKRIEVLLDRDHTIGHSYFINVKNENDLRNTFKNNIIPLLQEYFYGDYEKIGMVLGMEFFEEFEKFDNSLFAKFQTENYPQGGRFFRLKTINQDFEIIKAIQILMNKKVEETNV